MEMDVLCRLWKAGRDVCTVWHAELVFFVVVSFAVSRAASADAQIDRNLPGLESFHRRSEHRCGVNTPPVRLVNHLRQVVSHRRPRCQVF